MAGHNQLFRKSIGSIFEIVHHIYHSYLFTIRPRTVTITRSLINQYVVAFDGGMSAAQDGFDFASNGFSYINAISPTTSDAERISYVNRMKEIAKQGSDKSNAALEGFREVRKNIIQVSILIRVCELQFH